MIYDNNNNNYNNNNNSNKNNNTTVIIIYFFTIIKWLKFEWKVLNKVYIIEKNDNNK